MPDRLQDVNLLPQYERKSSSYSFLFIALIIIILLSYIFLAFNYFTTKNKVKSAETEYAELSERADELQAQLNQLETDGSSLTQAVAFVENHEIPTSSFIEELTNLLPDYSYLNEYEYSNQVAKIKTYFEKLDTVANYTTNLLTSDYVNDTKVDVVETVDYEENEGSHQFLVDFDNIPRYESEFTLKVNKQKLKGESREDE